MMKKYLVLMSLPAALAAAALPAVAAETALANASPASDITVKDPAPVVVRSLALRFVVVDPQTHQAIPGAWVGVERVDTQMRAVSAAGKPVVSMRTGTVAGMATAAFDTARWSEAASGPAQTVSVPLGSTVVLAPQAAAPAGSGKPRVTDIYIKVTATRAPIRAGVTAGGTTRSNEQLNTFVNRAGNDTGALTRGQSGVASDSAGQQHVRGEHADISFVVDGVPLPDTLSGRQGSVVVASEIRSLDILTGAFAPEYGGQTAAVLDIQTLPGATKATTDVDEEYGSYNSFNSNLTTSGPIGKHASYVINVSADRTDNALEPQQPDKQTAHNSGSDESYFAKFRVLPKLGDSFTVILSRAPGDLELSNRTGLSSRFASAGEGYGFLGLRNADGSRPDVTPENANALGAATSVLPSQQDDGMAIDQHEVNEFVSLAYVHALSARDTGQLSAVVLHSGQSVDNTNPTVNLNNLPVDNSIEYNPTVDRNVYHYQVTGDLTAKRGAHRYKGGLFNDQQSGDESYQLIPASQLALDELVAVDASLAPDGTTSRINDVDGNPVFTLASGATVPTLKVHRSGYYRAAYMQDTWQIDRQFTANYGLRYDWFYQTETLNPTPVDKNEISPRLNFSYALATGTMLRWSYDHLFNIPPLAQGAVVGAPIQPESLNQYDVSLERQVAPGQSAKAAYYYKQIRNQVDTGLLIPGSQIGLYSAVNFQFGAVHGLELSYDLSPLHGVGWDGYVNYSYSLAQPNGLDNTGAPAPQYNDHDQRHTLGAGFAYLFKGGASTAFTLNYGSGLASSSIPPSTSRIPRTEVDVHMTTGSKLLWGRGGLGLDVSNLFDSREVINFQSGFSGTRFQEGRRILGSVFVTL